MKTITLHDVSYEVFTENGCFRKASTNKILHRISAQFTPGLNAIFGPTGGGKSTLLDVISGRKPRSMLTGQVLIDGKKPPKNLQCMVGYVVQDDFLTGTLTVRENLMFSANLRLPTSISREDKRKKINHLLVDLGLGSCADSLVGSLLSRGISGGERKRTAIGMELSIDPSVLILDEPTTGLDATTARSVMTLLQSLSTKGKTVICSVHQARRDILNMIDNLVLLAGGRAVFHGSVEEALQHFEQCGFHCDTSCNPADFFLDVLHGEAGPIKMKTEIGKTIGYGDELVTSFSAKNEIDLELGQKETQPKLDIAALIDLYKSSSCYKELQIAINAIYKEFELREDAGEKTERLDFAVSFWHQVKGLSGRSFLGIRRNPSPVILQIALFISFALMTGIIYWNANNDVHTGIQNRVGAVFLIFNHIIFNGVSALGMFIFDRATFVHESLGGYYRVSAYFVCKVLFDAIPMRIIPTTFYAFVSYFMTGFRPDAGHFFVFYLTIVLSFVSAVSIAVFCGVIAGVFEIAFFICIFVYTLMMAFGGLLVNINSLPSWLSWLEYTSIFRYSCNALYINEMKDLELCGKTVFNETFCDSTLANDYLGSQGVAFGSIWNLWQNLVIMAAMTVFFYLVTYGVLRSNKAK